MALVFPNGYTVIVTFYVDECYIFEGKEIRYIVAASFV
mgnify:CR=1 FL=1